MTPAASSPGSEGREAIRALAAIALVGGLIFFGFILVLDGGTVHIVGDQRVLGWALDLRTDTGLSVARAVSHLGAFPSVAFAVLLAALWCARGRRVPEAIVLVAGFLLTWAIVTATKELVGRPRPSIASYDAIGLSYPSGHAANSMAYVAIAIVVTRLMSRHARFVAVAGAIALATVIGATRCYLGVHYLSDVLGGYGVAAMVFALVGMAALFAVHLRQTPSTP